MDSSREPGQGDRPSSDPAGSTGGGSSGWQSTPQTPGGQASWQNRPDQQPTGSTTPPTSSTTPPTWQSSPQPAPSQAAGSWSQPAAGSPVRGTAGFVYADVPNRAIAYIIDAIILGVIGLIVGLVLTGIIGPTVTFTDPTDPTTYQINTGATLISTLVSTIINGIYFVGTWISWRATPGQRILGMQVGNETDGATLTTNQAVTRWILLGAPFGVASALAGISGLGVLIGIAAFVWLVVLLVTTARSPTKQGLHDQYAHTVVVKAARTVG
jgi:uncharacterized RDD family membrane protein YckC